MTLPNQNTASIIGFIRFYTQTNVTITNNVFQNILNIGFFTLEQSLLQCKYELPISYIIENNTIVNTGIFTLFSGFYFNFVFDSSAVGIYSILFNNNTFINITSTLNSLVNFVKHDYNNLTVTFTNNKFNNVMFSQDKVMI